MKKILFVNLTTIFYITDRSPKNHWVGNSLMKTIGVDELFNKRVIVSELEYSLNDDDAIYSSVVTEKEI